MYIKTHDGVCLIRYTYSYNVGLNTKMFSVQLRNHSSLPLCVLLKRGNRTSEPLAFSFLVQKISAVGKGTAARAMGVLLLVHYAKRSRHPSYRWRSGAASSFPFDFFLDKIDGEQLISLHDFKCD